MRRLLISALAISLVACGSDDSTGPATSLAGTWALTRAAGAAPPATVYSDASVTLIILSGSLVLNANETWTGALVARTVTAAGSSDETFPASGTWSRNGNTVTLTDTSDPQNPLVATVSGNTLTASLDLDLPTGDVTVVFTKQ